MLPLYHDDFLVPGNTQECESISHAESVILTFLLPDLTQSAQSPFENRNREQGLCFLEYTTLSSHLGETFTS